jgi:hypothetical protein
MMAPSTNGVVMPLEERSVRIENIMDRTALELGAELAAARDEHPNDWREWVEGSLSFGLDTAQRLIAIHKAFEFVPPERRAALPKARTALYELTRLPADRLEQAIDSGDIHPGLTTRAARGLAPMPRSPNMNRVGEGPVPKVTLTANVVAQELMRFHRSQLEQPVLVALRRWCGPEWQWDIDAEIVER